MKKLLYFLMILLTHHLHAQKAKSNITFMQLSLGKVINTGPPSSLNADWAYERIFFYKSRWHIGAQAGFGYWSNGSIYADLSISGQKAFAAATAKYSMGKPQKHFLGIDGGYAFFNTGSIGGSAVPIDKHHYVPTATFTYQYCSSKGFYGRAGIGSWQGLLIGLGIRF